MVRKDKVFYDWLFHYNAYTDMWYAFTREDQNAYWNKTKPKHVIIKAKDLKFLMQSIQETKGDKNLLNERISGNTTA